MPTRDSTDIIILGTGTGKFLNKGTYTNRDTDVTIYLNVPSNNYDLLSLASETKDLYNTPIGRARNLDYRIVANAEEYYESGSTDPAELRPGTRSYQGSFERGFINVALIRMITGAEYKVSSVDNLIDQSVIVDSKGNTIPLSFDIHWEVRDVGSDNLSKVIVFKGATFTSLSGSSRENSYIIETATWKAKKTSSYYGSIDNYQASSPEDE